MQRHVTAVYSDPKDVRRVVDALMASGFELEHISLMMASEARNRCFSEEANPPPGGSGSEGRIGAFVDRLASIGATEVPGDLYIIGPLQADLGLDTADPVHRDLVTAFVRAGVAVETARAYVSDVASGGIVVGVVASNRSRLDDALGAFERLKIPKPRASAVHTRRTRY